VLAKLFGVQALLMKNVATLDEFSRYGLITAFDAIHDQAQPTQVLRGIAHALRPDGTFLMQDIRRRAT
jgi:hypothetical protein